MAIKKFKKTVGKNKRGVCKRCHAGFGINRKGYCAKCAKDIRSTETALKKIRKSR